MLNINNVLSPKIIAERAEKALQTPIKALPLKSDTFTTMTPQVKASIKEGVKKFDNVNILQKACRFISKSKVGKAIIFGAMALATMFAGKAVANNIEENIQ